MQTVLLIRHARATEREDWRGEDRLRPLTTAGRRQAVAIANELGESKIEQIRSSPALRCMETVQPLAQRAGVKMNVDDRLSEGSTIALPPKSRAGLHVLCAHGDNIPALLETLGINCHDCKKGSIWLLKRDGRGAIVETAYIEVKSTD
jgi:8-oxo-(d)GTP phosphatase